MNRSFSSEELDKVRLPHLSLGVPLLDDVVQIRAPAVNGKTRLYVDTSRQEMRIGREDKAPFQVQVHPKENESLSYYRDKPAVMLFVEPVNELILLREKGEGSWLPSGEDVKVTDTYAMIQFAHVMGQYAIRRQLQESPRLRFMANIRERFEGY